MDFRYGYIKSRRNMGRQPLFCEAGPDMIDTILPDTIIQKQFMLRNPIHQATQNTPSLSSHEVNTERAEYKTTGINHSEGGWAADVNVDDVDATARIRRRIEKDDAYIHCVNRTAPLMEHYILQNNATKLYETYFTELAQQPPIESLTCRQLNTYRDQSARPVSGISHPGQSTPRPISSIAWQPDDNVFAVTYCSVDFYRQPLAPTESYIWDVNNANSPETVITPPSPLLDLQFTKETNVLIGGMMNGEVAAFDKRTGEVTASSPPHVSHRDFVSKVLLINPKVGTEFFSGSADGSCKWWDLRDMSEPTDTMIMDVVKTSVDVPSMATANGVSVLEYEATIPTRFMVGTENGLILGGNRKGKTATEKLPMNIKAHNGPVVSLERNKIYAKNFLSVGDFTCKVWSEECRESAILWSPPQRSRFTSGMWSPNRVSMIVLTQSNGALTCWDLLRKQHEPVLTTQVCREPLLRAAFHDNAQWVACGSERGDVYLMELSPCLTVSNKNDKQLLANMLDREVRRERIIEARLREIKLKLKAEDESVHSLGIPDPSLDDADIIEATTDFFNIVKKEKEMLY
ncbi:unnamed protein product [Plutella xylostella]|uniref:(diamondback moth) hypothetical protein n=2 Tax=Plutella xylostella TaxID=51655 RepID=A0A8S4G9R2_PLUXY|nr:unnamed protein product [Plutella xylostella]